MEYEIILASLGDREEILCLYKAQLGREFCPWDDYYPSYQTIDGDMARNALFVLKKDAKIAAAISIEEDEEADKLPCWSKEHLPAGELARLAVLPEEQNSGLGRVMLRFGMDELRRRGFKAVRFLVNEQNEKAIRCYAVYGFNVAGRCHMYEQDFLCYEKEL